MKWPESVTVNGVTYGREYRDDADAKLHGTVVGYYAPRVDFYLDNAEVYLNGTKDGKWRFTHDHFDPASHDFDTWEEAMLWLQMVGRITP